MKSAKNKKMPKEKRYMVRLFGYVGNYCGKTEFNRFVSAWLYMWMNNGLCSSSTMIDKKTKKEYNW